MNLENRKRQLINAYIQFLNYKNNAGMSFYTDVKTYERAKVFLHEFRATKNTFINGVKVIKTYHYLYSQCICDYLELYLRDIGIVDKKSCAYEIPENLNNIEEILDVLILLVEEGLDEAEKCLNISSDGLESIDEGCLRGKRLILQKIIAVLGLLDLERYTDKFLYYAEEATHLDSVQAYAVLVLFYSKKEHLNLEKARALFEKCISLKSIDHNLKINEISQVTSKITAYSYLFHAYANCKRYDDALEIIKRNRQYLLLSECDVLSSEAKDTLFETLESYVSYIKKQQAHSDKEACQYDIFISYSSFDSLIIDEIIAKLTKKNVNVWRDVNNIRGGDSFIKEIPAAIKNSQVVLLLLTPEAEESKWVEREIITAIDEGKEIIPYKIGNYDSTTSIKFMLGNVQVIKNRTVPLDELVNILINKIKKQV